MGKDKNGIKYRGLRELMCTTNGYELSGAECWRVGGQVDRG